MSIAEDEDNKPAVVQSKYSTRTYKDPFAITTTVKVSDSYGSEYMDDKNDIDDIINGPLHEGEIVNIAEIRKGKKRWREKVGLTRDDGNKTYIIENNFPQHFLENIQDNSSSSYSEIAEESKRNILKTKKIHEIDPKLRLQDERIKLAESINIISLQTELLSQMKEHLGDMLIELREYKRIRTKEEFARGINFWSAKTLAPTENVLRIDFTDLYRTTYPTSAMTNFPSQKLFSISVAVTSGGPVYLSTNEDDTNKTFVKVINGKTYEAVYDKAVIKTLNIRAESSADIEILGTY